MEYAGFTHTDSWPQLVNVEPLLQGKYVKHNDNDGENLAGL